MADNTQEDLSMEDILSSIKNILVEDAQQQDDSAATPATPPVVENIADISISSLADDIALSEENFLKMLEAAYEHLDGVILWAHGRDADNKTKVNWEDERVQAIYRAIKTFTSNHNMTPSKNI